MFSGFFRRLAAGPQSAQQTVRHEGNVTITETEDTSAPYPHYMHQNVLDGGQAEQSAYDVICHQAGEQSTPEGNAMAGRMLGKIEKWDGTWE